MSFWDKIKHVASSIGKTVWDHRSDIANVVSKVIPFLMIEPPPEDPILTEPSFPVINYEIAIAAMIDAIEFRGEYILDDPDLARTARKLLRLLAARRESIKYMEHRLFSFKKMT